MNELVKNNNAVQTVKQDNEEVVVTYERMKGEGEKAFKYFTIYRDMGQARSYRKVAHLLGLHFSRIHALSAEWQWSKRVRLWSDELDRIQRETYFKEVKDMAKRHAKQSMAYQRVLQMPVESILKKLQDNDPSFRDFANKSVDELFDKTLKAAQILPAIIDIERKSRGEPSEIIKQDIENKTTSEIIISLPSIPGNLKNKALNE
jgi:hypothetical protein